MTAATRLPVSRLSQDRIPLSLVRSLPCPRRDFSGRRVLLVHDKCHDAGAAPFVGIGNQRVPGNHVSVDDVIIFSAGSMRALLLQDLEIVSVVRSAWPGCGFFFVFIFLCGGGISGLARVCISFLPCCGYQCAHGTGLFAFNSFPVEPIFLSRRARKLLSVFGYAITIVIALSEIFPLRQHVSSAGGDGGEFVFTNAPIKYFFSTGRGIKAPLVTLLDDWNGKRPIVCADGERNLVPAGRRLKLGRLIKSGDELVKLAIVLNRITGEQLVISRPKDLS